MEGKCFVVIPAFNEEKVIGSVINELKSHGIHNIIVVDDGSEDETAIVCRKLGVTVVRHSLNRGKGAAVKTGFEAAKLMNADIAVTFDADGQHDPADIQSMQRLILEGYDVVLGKRNYKHKHIPRYKMVGNKLGNLITWFLYGVKVSDSQFGLRSYSRKALNLIKTTLDRYEYDSEIIREIARRNLRYTEIFANVRYTDYAKNKKHKQSVINSIKTVLKMLITG